MKTYCILAIFVATLATAGYAQPGDEAARSGISTWAERADYAQTSLLGLFWQPYQSGYYIVNSVYPGRQFVNPRFNYWWMAHLLDVFADNYGRTRSSDCLLRMTQARQAMLDYGKGSLHNSYFDDMEWMALACLRIHQAVDSGTWKDDAITLWNDIKTGWNDIHGGGIQWVDTLPASKNACANAPAVIIAARLYQLTKDPQYLQWAEKIFRWLHDNLVIHETGLIKDSYNNDNPDWVFTYNQGTWLGACLELFRISGDRKYFDLAMRTADYVVNDSTKFSPAGVLNNNEGGGDGGLFKGIFMRYLAQWMLSGALDAHRQQQFATYFITNGNSLWKSALSRTAEGYGVFGNTWSRPRPEPQPGRRPVAYDSSVHLSAVMLFELLCELERNNLLSASHLQRPQ
ncbi:MAG: hypothetical protein LBR06_02235 [Bacteroidales bacterium]|jgi:predicted alpha-1,6-mannanase (GH76 family)|nr:hypothetical protein [Bacteroidales bacterium]